MKSINPYEKEILLSFWNLTKKLILIPINRKSHRIYFFYRIMTLILIFVGDFVKKKLVNFVFYLFHVSAQL